MSLLASFWLLSLSTLVGVTFYASHYRREVTARKVPHDFGEFVHDALVHLAERVAHVATSIRPHADKITLHIAHAGKWGHTKFTEHLFGRTTQAPGKTASFFLKYIAEHKEGEKGSPEQRAGL